MNSLDSSWPKRWQQLAVMIESGLPIDRALGALQSANEQPDKQLQRSIDLVKRGLGLAESFKRGGLINGFDYVLLKNAEDAGKVSAGLLHISEQRVSQLQRVNTLRALLLMPVGVLFIGAFAGVFVRILSGENWFSATTSVGAVVILVLFLTHLAFQALRMDSRVWLSYLWPVRFIRTHSERYQVLIEQLFYRSFIWQTESGIDAQEASKRCALLLKSKPFQDAAVFAAKAMRQGQSIPNSLNDHGLVLSKRMRQVLLIADQSGTYETAIKHELQLQYAELKRQLDATFKWIPRAYYVFILAIIGGFIMRS